MEKRNRKLAFLLALAACFIVLFSTFYIAAETDHVCFEENCPICYQISVCENTLKSLGYGFVTMFTSVALTFSVEILSGQPKTHFRKVTLITLKVKLSN